MRQDDRIGRGGISGKVFTGRVGSSPLNGNACVLTQARPAQVSRGRREIAEKKNVGGTVTRPPERMLQLFFGSFMVPQILIAVSCYHSRRGEKVKLEY